MFLEVCVKTVGCSIFCETLISSWGDRYKILTAVGVPAYSPCDYLRHQFVISIIICDSGTGL